MTPTAVESLLTSLLFHSTRVASNFASVGNAVMTIVTSHPAGWALEDLEDSTKSKHYIHKSFATLLFVT